MVMEWRIVKNKDKAWVFILDFLALTKLFRTKLGMSLKWDIFLNNLKKICSFKLESTYLFRMYAVLKHIYT